MLPICCLRWILQFAVFRSAFGNENHTSKINLGSAQMAVIRHLVEVWSEEKFIQAGDMQLQSCMFRTVMSLSSAKLNLFYFSVVDLIIFNPSFCIPTE